MVTLIIVLLIALDQISKLVVLNQLADGTAVDIIPIFPFALCRKSRRRLRHFAGGPPAFYRDHSGGHRLFALRHLL